jgi:BASS family bile acid:Na+ symporter
LASVFSIKLFADKSDGGSNMALLEGLEILPYVLFLHLSTMIISYFVARRKRLNNKQSTTIAIEVGLQNTTLALLISGTLIGNNEMTKPAIVLALFSFFTTFFFAYVVCKKKPFKIPFIK